MRKFATLCLTGVLCLSAGSIQAEAAGITGSVSLEGGIAAVITEANLADPEADTKVLEELEEATSTDTESVEEAEESGDTSEAADTEEESSSVSLEAGIASVISEAYEADPEADTKVLEELEETASTDAESVEETSDTDEADGESSEDEETSDEDGEDTEETEDSEYEGLCIATVTNYVNIRSEPSEEGEILGKLYDDSAGTISEEVDGWYLITSGSVTGYVKADYVVTGEEAEALAEEVGVRVATVTTETLRVREEASTESSILGLIGEGEELTVTDEEDGWVQVSIEEGDGWVSGDYVELRTDFVEAESIEEEEARLAAEEEAKEEGAKLAAAAETTVEETEDTSSTTIGTSSGTSSGNAVVSYASQFIGNPYVYGGSSLTNGTDCSGFVMSVYAHFGVSLPHSSTAMRSVGYEVSLADAQPGDIICYSGHVAIYCGNNTVIHASTPATGITYTSPANYKSIICVRRIF